MREIWVIERDRVSHDGCTVLCERKYRGLLREDGSFCLLAYRAADDIKFWIITEADRSSTTVLLPDEY